MNRVLVLFSFLIFVVASVIISSIIRDTGIENVNYITVKRLSEKEVLLSWNL
ncbi:hypothetical protein [Borrelia coriaceae]|uniref:hypothetical protein n=1 Tax=Borrelia coriaceae TaxID=144 RepID=UPI001F526977|nr:hypothetical protein [Borrelia coriaceae]